ncbi:MAG: PF20097 family protein [Candidatus Bathyarchaeia archaeon]
MNCPFCKVPMTKGYLSLLGDGSALYFCEERISYTTGRRGKKKEAVLEGGAFGLAWEEDYSRTAYKCNECNAIVLEGKPKPAYIDAARAAEAETDKENLKDRIRQTCRF